ncbi:MAG: UDP-N-acetylmuramate--L-alanine ligase [Alphaproteobacteria bacterium]|nr:UDP-N-acetylmuramate--L-alanine ligase [Alphaproteobacteria bacterium]
MNIRPMPLELGPIHFVGIGGIGMSGIAEILLRQGYRVQGSDARESANTERLRTLGADIAIGHLGAHVSGASAVVYSSAIKPDNPEILAARAARIPLVRRAEMLGELMRMGYSVAVAGTHGKTTTTSMVAAVLDAAGLDPTVVNGGVINAYGANAKVGGGDWTVVEADESDGTFLRLKATVAVVTNIDPEHLDHHGDFENLKRAFRDFVVSIPFYGFAVLCADHPVVQELAAEIENRRLITYGVNPQASLRAQAISMGPEGARFEVVAKDAEGETQVLGEVSVPMAGQHNVLNALAAIAVARELGAPFEAIQKGLAEFGGVRRRFTTTGVVRGVRVIDDYGHHPVEIASVLAAARRMTTGRILAVVQPHRYTRLRDLFPDFCRAFNDADAVWVADVYAAGEAPIEGVDRDALVAGLIRHGHREAYALAGPEALTDLMAAHAEEGDMIIFLGAGDITAWAHALPEALSRVLTTPPSDAGAAPAPERRAAP